MELEELLEVLARLRREHADDADYRRLRSALPADWPL
jgi:hypothetical protein